LMRCEVLLVALYIALPTAVAAWRWTTASASAETRATEASPATGCKVSSEATTATRTAESTSRSQVTAWTRWGLRERGIH
jgi:hypothetical protein